MAISLILCDQSGNETNTFNPTGDVFLKVTDTSGFGSYANEAVNGNNEQYEINDWTFGILGFMFALGSGATNCATNDGFEDWSLFLGAGDGSTSGPDYDESSSYHTGYTANGFMSFSPTHPMPRLPYYFGNRTSASSDIGSISSPVGGMDEIFIPQANITGLEQDDSGDWTDILIRIPNSVWDGVFTSTGISWDYDRYKNCITNGDEESDILNTITGGTGWGNSAYPSWDGSNLLVPYDLMEGKKISFGCEVMLIRTQNGTTFQMTGSAFLFDNDADASPFSNSNIALIPNLNFDASSTPPFVPPEFSVTAFPSSSIEFDPININEGEITSSSVQFIVNEFVGTVGVYAFDSQDVENETIPEWATSFGNFDETDDVAVYGVVAFNEGAGHSIDNDGNAMVEVASGGLGNAPLTYTANDVGVDGQLDEFSVFIRLETIDVSSVGEGVPEWQEIMQQNWIDYFLSLSDADKTFKVTVAPPINISDIPDPNLYYPSDELITNPTDVIFHLVEQELKYDKNINADKIIEARDNHIGWKYAFSINEEIDSKKLLQEMAQSTKLIPTFNNDTFSYANIHNTYTGYEEISEIKAGDVIKYNVSRTDLDSVYTEVEVQYEYDYGLDNHISTTDKLKINTDFYQNAYGVTMNYGQFLDYDPAVDEKNNYYGLDFDKETNILNHEDTSLIFKSDYIRDPQTARLLAEHLLLFHSNQHNIIDMTLPLKYYNLEVGDLVEFDEMIMGRKLYGEKYVLDEVMKM